MNASDRETKAQISVHEGFAELEAMRWTMLKAVLHYLIVWPLVIVALIAVVSLSVGFVALCLRWFSSH